MGPIRPLSKSIACCAWMHCHRILPHIRILLQRWNESPKNKVMLKSHPLLAQTEIHRWRMWLNKVSFKCRIENKLNPFLILKWLNPFLFVSKEAISRVWISDMHRCLWAKHNNLATSNSYVIYIQRKKLGNDTVKSWQTIHSSKALTWWQNTKNDKSRVRSRQFRNR
jgi:hypothetical protein